MVLINFVSFKVDERDNRAIYTRKNKPRLISDEMCHLYGKFASYLRRVFFFSYKWP